ncbi:MAG: cysteine desulfurase [Nitrososphaerota archaeon]|nr:cysteine desulfurase [Nitrososphaerota archaeon]MDG6920693.1 cysteine desulfurase [Nitrososphaerota archaeon]MDG6947390.1 cysteine desulfurase [Nitrososphaerota archaeon]
MNAERMRADFPILSRKVHGKRLVYLDNAATTQKPQAVIDALVRFYSTYNSNVHRSVHTLGEEATEAYEGSRKKTAEFVGAKPRDLVFVRGTTEAINLVGSAWGEKNVKKGDVIVATKMEHHSNIVPWQQLAKRNGASLKYVGLDTDGTLDLAGFEDLLREAPRLVALTHCSNVLGTVNDVTKLCSMAKMAGATTLVDGAQSVPHMPVDVEEIGSDFYAFSGHKMLGPTGIGALVARKGLLEEMDPFQTGGEMIREVFDDHSTWNDVPYKFEAGTVNIADAIGLGAAVDYLDAIGMERVRDHELRLLDYAFKELASVKGLKIYGPSDTRSRAGVISFNYADVHPHDLATILDEEGIAIRSGHHCAQPLMRWLDVPATSRASFYIYNAHDDVDALKAGIVKAGGLFKV